MNRNFIFLSQKFLILKNLLLLEAFISCCQATPMSLDYYRDVRAPVRQLPILGSGLRSFFSPSGNSLSLGEGRGEVIQFPWPALQ